MRLSVCAALLCLSVVGLSFGADAHASIRKTISIPAQGLGPALNAFAKERDLQVVYRSEIVGSLRTGGASGDLTVDEALNQLLNGTGLTYRYVDDKTVTILPAGAASSQEQGTALPVTGDDPSGASAAAKEGKKDSSSGFRLAQLDQGKNSQSSSVDRNTATSQDSSKSEITEIVVTAQKKSERLQDVPVPVTAIDADTLVNSNQLRLQDYYTSVPGLSVTPRIQSSLILAIRGITTGPTNPTVGVTVDDVPYGSSTSNGGGAVVPDIDPGDLARVEVLRGPQGTLYGANSMGGLLKFVTVDPSTDAVSGHVQV